MAKTTQVQEQTMEEILASIRRIISDDEARGTPARPSPARPVSNVSHLFAEPSPPSSATVVELPIEPAPVIHADAPEEEDYTEADEPVAAEIAIDEVAFAAALQPEEPSSPAELAPEPRRDPQPPASQPLLSPRADAAVSSAFGSLADTFFSARGRTVESLVEDMLRPMLKTWLDHNLPPLVERLVREEIERVARRRR